MCLGATVIASGLACRSAGCLCAATFGGTALEQIAQIPIFIPPFVGAVAWALLFAPRVGAVNRILIAMGVPWQFDIYTHSGMLG